MKKGVLDKARGRAGRIFLAIMLFSTIVNVLMLTGPFYMLQVYDRVLGSRSVETLIALTAIMVFLFAVMGAVDHVRARLAARAGARLQSDLDGAAFKASLLRLSENSDDMVSRNLQRDLENTAKMTASPAFLALFDIPWIPLFLGAIFVLHPVLGAISAGGGLILILLAILANQMTAGLAARNAREQAEADRTYASIQRDADIVLGMGMRRNAFGLWAAKRKAALTGSIASSDLAGGFSSASRVLRQILQSLILGAGAWLVIADAMTPGGMIASSVLMGRALAPVDAVIGQWGAMQRGWQSWGRVKAFLKGWSDDAERTELPRPAGHVRVEGVTAGPPGKRIQVLRNLNFEVRPGRALGVVGPSGAGKSSLARVIMGTWMPLAGRVTLDAAPIQQYEPDRLGSCIGYLPQAVRLMDGTIAQNIARFDPEARDEDVIAAAVTAGAHEMILSFPNGYDTRINPEDPDLSGGQMQRIGLARALYLDPPVIILDEPNSAMDGDGSARLNAAIRTMKARGSAIVIMAHRPSAIEECDDIMVMDQGQIRVFGPKGNIVMNGSPPEAAQKADSGKPVRRVPVAADNQRGGRLDA